MKHHERRELVNTLTKIAREYGQTQQLRERIAHALPFDCDAIDARAMGQQGSPADEAERLAFEAWATPDCVQSQRHPETGEYIDHGMHSAWAGWQAAVRQNSGNPSAGLIMIKKDRDWREYPIGTKAHAYNGGAWLRTDHGWQWNGGSTFPTPGADAIGYCIELPEHASVKIPANHPG